MKILVDLQALQSAVAYIQKAIAVNPQLPILSSINIEVKKTKMVLSATDLYLGIKTEILVSSDEEVAAVVPGEVFKDLINSFSTDQIELKFNNNQLEITSGQSRVKIPAQSAEEFPDFPEPDGQKITITSEILEEVKSLVAFAASTDQVRPILTTILFDFKESGLEVVGTDGFRLAILNYPQITVEKGCRFLIPAKAFSEVCRIANQTNAKEVELQVSQELRQTKFQIDSCEVYVRLIEGDYPPYKKIIPEEYKISASLSGEDLLKELKRALVLARESSNIVKLKFFESGLEIGSSSSAHGEYRGEVTAAKAPDSKEEIAFNINYLLDFLSSAKPETVKFSINEKLKPAEFEISGFDNFRYIVMPFRAND